MLTEHGDWEVCKDQGKAKVTPVFENGRKEDLGNYRPWEGDGPTALGNHFQTKKGKKVSGQQSTWIYK